MFCYLSNLIKFDYDQEKNNNISNMFTHFKICYMMLSDSSNIKF